MEQKEMKKIWKKTLNHRHIRPVVQQIKAEVPYESIFGLVLYLLYTSEIPKLKNNAIVTFRDDTAILAIREDHEDAP